MPGKRLPIEDRFWSKVKKTSTCWLWVGKMRVGRYGGIAVGKRGEGVMSTHRLSWELHNGPIPNGLLVLHDCDNKLCVNPDHMHLGTYSDNMQEAHDRGLMGKTGPKKGKGAKMKLSVDQLNNLRVDAEVMTQALLAKKYGIGQSTISRILRGISCSKL